MNSLFWRPFFDDLSFGADEEQSKEKREVGGVEVVVP